MNWSKSIFTTTIAWGAFRDMFMDDTHLELYALVVTGMIVALTVHVLFDLDAPNSDKEAA